MFDQRDQNVKLDKQEQLDLGYLIRVETLDAGTNSPPLLLLLTSYHLEVRRSSIVQDLLAVKRRKEAKRRDRDKMAYNVRSEEPSDDYVLQDRPKEHTLHWGH